VPANTERLNTALAGRYRIERHLGEGGMASVYLAEDLKHERKVALKLLKPELAAVLGADRFVQEIKTTAALQHPHILPLFDSGTADGFLFYVMPWIQGETLRDKLNRETQLGVDEAVRIAREVADALDYAHRNGVIHRDIKPENILLHDGRPMVADFGIALAVSAAAGGRMTETGLSLGTPYYMSPEQATAEKEISARSDVYSLGCVLYEMLTGNPPHVGASAQQTIMKIIAEPVEMVTKHRKAVPPNVAAAVMKSLEKLPADRFESAKAFGEALGNPAYTNATFAGDTIGATMGARGSAAHTFTPPFIAVSVLAAAALVAAVWGWRHPEATRDISRFSLQLPDSQALAEGGQRFRVAVSPDGRKIAYLGRASSPLGARLMVRSLDQLRATPLAGTDGAINPAFSPDGKHLAFAAGAPRAIKTIAVAGGPTVTLTDSLVDTGGITWGHDGYVYYDGHLTGDGLARVRETGGKPEIASTPIPASGEMYHINPAALPNGRGVIFTIARSTGLPTYDIAVLDTKTGKHKALLHGVVGMYSPTGHLVYVTSEGTLMAAPFDQDRMTLVGEAVPIAEGVAVRAGSPRADVGISTNGLLVYAAGSSIGNVRELAWVSRDGTATPVDPQWTGPFARVMLSPDGKAAAVGFSSSSVSRQVWIKQLDRGPASKITDAGSAPAWSPDGKSVVFSSQIGLQRAPADGSALPVAIAATSRGASQPEYSRDGKWIVFSRSADLFAIRTDGDTAVHPLVATPATEAWPTISSDGRWLAYSADETGRLEVYVRPFPDTRTAKRQVSVTGGFLPRWSRDGRELFFLDEKFDLISVPVTPGAAFSVGNPRRLFPAEQYLQGLSGFDVHPDGKRFLMTRPVGSAPKADELILVQNFFEELKAKAPAKK
jgi:serine/threonine-protein kinase